MALFPYLALSGTNTEISNYPASGSNTVHLYARNVAGRMMPEYVGPNGQNTSIQPALWSKNIVLWSTGNTTTAAISFGTSFTVSTTQAHPTQASTNFLTAMRRATYTTTTTINNASGVRAAQSTVFRGNATGLGGFYFFGQIGVVTFTSAQQIMLGLSPTAVLAGEPSARNDTVCLCKDSTDTNWQVAFRDNATTTKIDLGLAVAANQVLTLEVFCPPAGSTIFYRVERIDDPTGVVVLADNLEQTTSLPRTTVFIAPHAFTRTTTAAVTSIALSNMYVASNY